MLINHKTSKEHWTLNPTNVCKYLIKGTAQKVHVKYKITKMQPKINFSEIGSVQTPQGMEFKLKSLTNPRALMSPVPLLSLPETQKRANCFQVHWEIVLNSAF